MEIKEIFISDYKSLVNLKIENPNPFTVFAGANASGKSNIFEALEFAFLSNEFSSETLVSLFGGTNQFLNYNATKQSFTINFDFGVYKQFVFMTPESQDINRNFSSTPKSIEQKTIDEAEIKLYNREDFKSFFNHTRIFINKSELNRIKITSNKKLLPDASNLSSIIKKILSDNNVKEEFLELLQLFIPEFENIDVHSDIDGNDRFLIFEKNTKKAFDKKLISDGTYNILALLAAVYQTNEPQFLCIEEPENGLNPYVIKSLANFFRNQCLQKGHIIWLNTHSQTLIKELQPQELILVEKNNGVTSIKQFSKNYPLFNLTLDEAWLSNALGGGLPW